MEASGQRAALPTSLHDMLDLNEVDFVAQDTTTSSLYVAAPTWSTIDTRKTPLTIGVDAIDVMTPVIEGGITLVVDAGQSPATFEALSAKTLLASDVDDVVVLGCEVEQGDWRIHRVVANPTTYGWSYALRAAMSWAATLRDEGNHVLLLVELPTLGGAQEILYQHHDAQTPTGPQLTHHAIIDELSEALPSTEDGRCSILARLPLGVHVAHMSILLDSLSFGDVDSQLALSEDGAYAPPFSRTRIDFEDEQRQDRRKDILMAFQRSGEIGDRVAIFGEDDCEEADLELLRLAKQYEYITIQS